MKCEESESGRWGRAGRENEKISMWFHLDESPDLMMDGMTSSVINNVFSYLPACGPTVGLIGGGLLISSTLSNKLELHYIH